MIRANQHGTKSIFAGDEPRNNELTTHWPKPKVKRHAKPPAERRILPGFILTTLPPAKKPKRPRHRVCLSKRTMKRNRKDKLNKHADMAAYQARLPAPWPLVKKGGQKKATARSGQSFEPSIVKREGLLAGPWARDEKDWLPRGGTKAKH